MAGRQRIQVGSGPWIAEERSSAMDIARSEVEEFTFSARNDFDWLNEHMAEIFSENQINVAEIFKTPGKLRGKTPRTVRKGNAEARVPLSNIFSSTPKGAPNPFAIPNNARQNTPRVKIAVDPQPSPERATTATKQASPQKPKASKKPESIVDSGYHGSQSQDVMDIDEPTQPSSSPGDTQRGHVAFHLSPTLEETRSPQQQQSGPADNSTQFFTAHVGAAPSPTKRIAPHESTTPVGSPHLQPDLPDVDEGPSSEVIPTSMKGAEDAVADAAVDGAENMLDEPMRSPSDGSSPIRPIVRKSSLNFASLPAREPITHKSIGNRVSRTSHLDQNRTSYYRHTGGKSLGYANQDLTDDENDEMDVDDFPDPPKSLSQTEPDTAATHNKTYTQRLQDQINKLGKTQASMSQTLKSTAEPTTSHPPANASAPAPPTPITNKLSSPKKTTTTPGAFPEEDDDDDWIQPLGSPDDASNFRSPRPGLAKSYTADVMEGVSGTNTVSGQDFDINQMRPQTSQSKSPQRLPDPERAHGVFGHHKSMSVPVLPIFDQDSDSGNAFKKTISVSNPTLAPVLEDDRPSTPKSPSRGFSNSPLKQVKNKLSSILKSSRGLLASSAAISAEGKSSLLSPSTTRLGLHLGPSTETLGSPLRQEPQPAYPDLSRQISETQTLSSTASPTRGQGKRTRASTEREKAEEKRQKEEAKEARRLAEQAEKLEKAREKEREKARVFSKEQDRVVAQEKQLAFQREQEKRAAIATPGNVPKATRSSPRKGKAPATAVDFTSDDLASDEKAIEDIEMTDATVSMPPPSAPRSALPSSAMKAKEVKRPVRPAKEAAGKAKQAPTVIRVNMGSQHPQYHPSNSALASNLHDTLSQPQLKSKASQPSLQTKTSLQSLKSSTSSSGRPKALEAAARRKEQEEREAQRKRDAKAELERKRAAMQEEERRQEHQRKLEAEQQKEEERRQAIAQAEAKKNAQRLAMLEKAKQTRAPPPAVRTQPNGPPDHNRSEAASVRPPSRMNAAAPRSQQDGPSNIIASNGGKCQSKRPFAQDQSEDRQPISRTGNGTQSKENKRMRMTDELNEPGDREKQPSLKGAPVRPSGGFKKDLPTKPMFPAGYSNAQPGGTRDLFKATVTSQHNSQAKIVHPLDMAQLSKGAIPFAQNPHGAGSSSKTPARPGGIAGAKSAAKSATRSSPRFVNGESIELPEINTDDEDSENEVDTGKTLAPDWTDSPNLRRALMEQESRNPFEIFGAPAPINMEEVFAKSKDRFHKFRARTSSANWSGPDGLTEEDIRKDLAAREKMRKDGGWSYDMGREMI